MLNKVIRRIGTFLPLFAVVLMSVSVFGVCSRGEPEPQGRPQPQLDREGRGEGEGQLRPIEVSLESSLWSEARYYRSAPTDQKRTVFSVLEELREEKGFSFRQSGEGDLVFIDEMEGIRNQGRGGKNWIYTVNGVLADRGVASMWVLPGAKVSWCFVSYEERNSCGRNKNFE